MNDNLRDRVISSFGLTPKQQTAALERGRDVVVTAGAGSGKTRTLVARYASLLADGHSPRQVVAITFTEKAAREMRSRVRQALSDLALQAADPGERQRWVTLSAEMDAAHIGTIHGLCAEILRAHPAEAGIDPRFEVLDEGLAAALRVQLIEDTMAVLVGIPEFTPLFSIFGSDALKKLLTFLLGHRLEANEILKKNIDSSLVIRTFIEKSINAPAISSCIADLRNMQSNSLRQDAGDKLADQVMDLLALWGEAEKALAAGDIIACAGYLFTARRDKMKGNIGSKTSQVKAIVAEIKDAYDQLLNPIIGGENSKDQPADKDSEARFTEARTLIGPAFERLEADYQTALGQRRALDFDDLEYGAAQLLKRPEIQTRWQGEIAALLVDEFQDTNQRQRQIVEALAGTPGRLFVVGDARQSIYRFRRADVTVFSEVQQRVKAQGGLVIDLDQTYRAHEPLLTVTGDLLEEMMGTEKDPSRPYYVPFSPLTAKRITAPEYISAPHVEVVLGCGLDAANARPLAARALATRLLELKGEKQIRTWDDVALLLRASTGFVYYENAFEDAGIPFVTVAGRGFYERPEIRDVLNILRALSDPADDLAMAGLLRSPAFGLSDAALYRLRWRNEKAIPYWTALQADLALLDSADQPYALRARTILTDLLAQVDRIPVSELLKNLVDATDYRAILAVEDKSGTGGRLWRNLDKLLADAQSSAQVNVRDFLDYLVTLNDAGAREGEAPAEALGAVRLMSIHKSKGLEFPLVVLADASREPHGGSDAAYLLPDLGLAFKLDPEPLLYRLSKWQDQLQNDAETQRLLYVALTRAQDKLIINGHSTQKVKWTMSGWMDGLCTAAQMEVASLLDPPGTSRMVNTRNGHAVRAFALSAEENADASAQTPDQPGQTAPASPLGLKPIYQPLDVAVDAQAAGNLSPVEEAEQPRPWRATGSETTVPRAVLGKMVHKAIQHWLFPGDQRLNALLEAAAQNAGLAQLSQRTAAVQHAIGFMARLEEHPLRQEIEAASQQYHELPYSRMVNGRAETGYIDLLYGSAAGWQIVDFKTDSIHSTGERAVLVSQYTPQMSRYASAVQTLTGQPVQARICFLDDHGRISLVAVKDH